VGPIINGMVAVKDIVNTPDSEKINDSANLALTNITAAQVVWPRGGGNIILLCPKTPKECWSEWWHKNEPTFSAKAVPKRDRDYMHYPNYGIYQVWEGPTIRETDKDG
jgi:hypothetical protein